MQTETFRHKKTGANANESFEVGVSVQRNKPNDQAAQAMVTIQVPTRHESILQKLANANPSAQHGHIIQHRESDTSAMEFEFNLRELSALRRSEEIIQRPHFEAAEKSDIAFAVFQLIEEIPGYKEGRAFSDHTELPTFDNYTNWEEFVDKSKPDLHGRRTQR